ncbi:MAG TPA: M23 family metallopeptidase [Gammaproteobacteria bacterium]|nr:M23 family metallopeptidase [Gammaproteobacteria bacterium]
MNIILFTRRHGSIRQIDLAGRRVWMPLATAGVILMAGLFAGGYYTAAAWQDSHPAAAAKAWQARLARQQKEIARARREARDNLQALSQRVGELQARVTRLDALGSRLTQMAGLKNGEFDFDRPPGEGGPDPAPGTEKPLSTSDFLHNLDQLQATVSNRSRQLGILEQMLLRRHLHAEVMPKGRPVRHGWLSSGYGPRIDPFTGKEGFHPGFDFAGKRGTKVHAVAAGVVDYAGRDGGYGNLVEINHGGGYKTRYGHNEKILVHVGETVKRGQVISLMGSTGRSTGPHVHFEVRYDGRAINPARFVRAGSGH